MIAEFPQDQPSKKIRQGLALPIYTVGLLLDYLSAALRRLAELAISLALVASFVLVMLIRLVIRDFPDMDGIDG
jgi:hypothetical protein